MIYPPSASTLHRHSVYSALEVEPIMLESSKALPSKGSEKHYQHHYPYHQMHHSNPVNSNRYSLNFSPTSSSDNSHTYNNTIMRKSPTINMDAKFPLQQSTIDYALKNSADSFLHSKSPMSSLDFKPNSSQHYQYQPQQQDLISLKSQNSIDSFLSPKSPPSMEMPTKPSMRDTTDLYMTRRLSKNVSKYPSDSDSLGMSRSRRPTTHCRRRAPCCVPAKWHRPVMPIARVHNDFSQTYQVICIRAYTQIVKPARSPRR